MTHLVLAVNPQPQQRPVVVRHGRRINTFTPERTEAFYTELRWALKAAGVHQPVSGPLRVVLKLWRRCRGSARGDLDNMVKAILDAGNGFLWDDDEQVIAIDARLVAWGPKVDGRIEMDVTSLRAIGGVVADTETDDLEHGEPHMSP